MTSFKWHNNVVLMTSCQVHVLLSLTKPCWRSIGESRSQCEGEVVKKVWLRNYVKVQIVQFSTLRCLKFKNSQSLQRIFSTLKANLQRGKPQNDHYQIFFHFYSSYLNVEFFQCNVYILCGVVWIETDRHSWMEIKL